jgi:ribosomal protein S18 acetylase RimI-like enzyme
MLEFGGSRAGFTSPVQAPKMSGIDIQIRQAVLADTPVIAEFNLRLAEESENLRLDPDCVHAGVDSLLRDPAKGLYFVAEAEGMVVGQVMITYEWSDWRNGNLWWLQSVYVKPEFRQLGIFRRLFEYLQKMASEKTDVRTLRLYMHSENTRARKTYEKLGMKPTHYEVFELELPNT